MQKLLLSYFSIFLTLMIVACGDDNSNDPLSPEANKFVGTWHNNQSYVGIYYTFQSNGKCFSAPFNGNPDYLAGTSHRGTWKYIADQDMLITTLELGGDSWKIYDISPNSWTGQIQTSTFPTFSYTRYKEPAIPAKDEDWCPSSLSGRKILMDMTYSSSDNEKFNDIQRGLFYENYVRCFSYDSSKDTRSGYRYYYSKISPTEGKLRLSHPGTVPGIYYTLEFVFESNTTFIIRGQKQIGNKLYQISGSGKYVDNILVD